MDWLGRNLLIPLAFDAAGTPLLLDSVSAKVAISTRKLRTVYAGSSVRIREDVGQTESDFAFTGDPPELDTAAIATFLAGANGLIVTGYDQSGNGADVTQAVAGTQPSYVASGINSKPILRFDTTQFLRATAKADFNFMHTGDNSVFIVWNTTDAAPDRMLIFDSTDLKTAEVGVFLWLSSAGNEQLQYEITNGTGAVVDNTSGNNIFLPQVANLITSIYENGKVGDDAGLFINGVSKATADSVAALSAADSTRLMTFGARGASAGLRLKGDLAEIVLFDSEQSANQSTLETNILAYWGI